MYKRLFLSTTSIRLYLSNYVQNIGKFQQMSTTSNPKTCFWASYRVQVSVKQGFTKMPGLKTEAKIHILKGVSGVIKPSRKVFREL